MPVVAVNLSLQVISEIRSLVENGVYTSPEQFLEIAAYNQLALERGSRPDAAQASQRKPDDERLAGAAGPSAADHVGRRSSESSRTLPVGAKRRAPVDASDRDVHETLQRLSRSKIGDGLPASRPTASRPDGERVWGQINRLFPLKLACRAIAVAATGRRAWEKLDAVTQRLGDDASVLGSALETCDRTAGRKRDELLATALPRKGNAASQIRFLSQFIARTTRAGDIYAGAICQYALADFDGERLGLSAAGVDLARLANPVLDASALDTAASTLSDDERSFLLRHVLSSVPGDRRDFTVVLAVVHAGATTPDALMGAVRSQFPDNWSALMVRTHVSGLVARMADLGLLRREWTGRNAKYHAGAAAAEFVVAPAPRTGDHRV